MQQFQAVFYRCKQINNTNNSRTDHGTGMEGETVIFRNRVGLNGCNNKIIDVDIPCQQSTSFIWYPDDE